MNQKIISNIYGSLCTTCISVRHKILNLNDKYPWCPNMKTFMANEMEIILRYYTIKINFKFDKAILNL